MFLDQGKLKKLMKKAYDVNQLYVSRRRTEFLITNHNWILKVDITSIPSKTLGSMIELIRDFPEDNQAVIAGKGSVQYVIDETFDVFWKQMENLHEMSRDLEIDMIPLISHGIQLMKGIDVVGIRQDAAETVKPEEIIKEIETDCRGPYIKDAMVYWKNDSGIYGINIEEENWKTKILEMLSLEIQENH